MTMVWSSTSCPNSSSNSAGTRVSTCVGKRQRGKMDLNWLLLVMEMFQNICNLYIWNTFFSTSLIDRHFFYWVHITDCNFNKVEQQMTSLTGKPRLTSVNWLTGTSSKIACGPGGTRVIARCVSFLTPSSILPPLQYHLGASTRVTFLPSMKPCRSWQLLEAPGEMGESWARIVSANAVFPHPIFPKRSNLRSEDEDP